MWHALPVEQPILNRMDAGSSPAPVTHHKEVPMPEAITITIVVDKEEARIICDALKTYHRAVISMSMHLWPGSTKGSAMRENRGERLAERIVELGRKIDGTRDGGGT
jgi:hypothetical protein